MKKYSLTLIVVLALFALTTRLVYAWPEEPFAKLEITGPGINGTTSITDAALLKSMTIDGFTDFTAFIPAPEGIGAGYSLHRFFQNQDGSYWDFDRVVYYPDPQGGPGFVYYAEAIGYWPGHNVGYWFRSTPEGEAAMQRLLQSLSAKKHAQPTAPAWPQIASVVAAFGAMVLYGWLLSRKAAPARPATAATD